MPRFTVYRAICEQLETIDHVRDATDCFYQMMSKLGGEINLHAGQAEWALGEKLCMSCR